MLCRDLSYNVKEVPQSGELPVFNFPILTERQLLCLYQPQQLFAYGNFRIL